jgi:hypothetical protein
MDQIMEPELVLSIYGGSYWASVLSDAWPGKVIHGEGLVLSMACADNVYRARRVLQAAETLGHIRRIRYRPTSQQCFFGSNSQFGSACLDPSKTDHDPTMCEFEILEAAFPSSVPKIRRMIHELKKSFSDG